MFRKEIYALKKLQGCNNIVSYYGYSVYEEKCMVVMELAENGNLMDYLSDSDNHLDDQVKEMIIQEVAYGLSFIHQLGVVHRDLKSNNILLDGTMHPKIADFGLGSVPNGAVRWRAPEVLNDFNQYTAKSDVFSYGVIVWEILHRRLPSETESDDAVRYKVIDGMQESIQVQFKKYHTMIEACWKQNPDERPEIDNVIE
ncbi:uncharacterized protein VTP21DRAFT_9745 [Calcarisporiella thermophila]|uniref:uncharacterized protein n=1 Tax=Calcarisporiella thermophila TaxID=911321 RepID=UPI00374375B1